MEGPATDAMKPDALLLQRLAIVCRASALVASRKGIK